MTERKPHTLLSALRVGVRSMQAHHGLAAAFLTMTLGQGALQGLLIWTLRWVLIRFTDSNVTAPTLVLGALLIFALWIVRALGTYAGEVFAVRLARRVETDALQSLFAKLLTLSLRFFDKASRGDLVSATYNDIQRLRTVTINVGTIVLAISRLIGLGVVAFLLSPLLALVGIVTVPVGVLPAYVLGRTITASARAERGSVRSLYDCFLELLAGIRSIKVNRGEEILRRRGQRIGEEMYRHAVRQAKAHGLARLLLESVSGLGLIAVLVVGGKGVAAGTMNWQTLLTMLVAIMAVYAPVVNLVTMWGQVRQAIPYLDRMQAVLDEQADGRDAPHAQPLLRPPETIELDRVSFAYDQQGVLHSISATFQRGETIGIVGPSGAGKSTLIALMLRLYEPSSGRLRFDGVDIRQLRHSDILDRSALVPQEPFLFVDTIANNIRFSRREAPLGEVVEAAKAANVHEEITAMDQGYETIVGNHEDGRGLSVGQRQRIAIASALMKDAPILYLDEATSNLDTLSEQALRDAIDRVRQGRTTFIVAHRLTTLALADRIMVLDRGCLVGLGRHDELLMNSPTYRRLWEGQRDPRGDDGDEPRNEAALSPREAGASSPALS